MIGTPEQDLERELKNPEYAKLYGASDAKVEIAIAISNARREAGKTQKELADMMGLSQPYIARLEGGDANPTIGTIGSLLASLGFRLAVKTVPLLSEITESGAEFEVLTEVSRKEQLAIQKKPNIRYYANKRDLLSLRESGEVDDADDMD